MNCRHAPLQYLIATDEFACKCGKKWPWDSGSSAAYDARNHLRAVLQDIPGAREDALRFLSDTSREIETA